MNKIKENTRRKALTILGGGLLGASQLPKAWTRPVVNSIVLPAHAQTTNPDTQSQPDEAPVQPALPTHFRDTISFNPLTDQASPARTTSDLLSLLVSDAQAGKIPASTGDLSINSPDGINFTAILAVTEFGTTGTLLASGLINGGPAILTTTATCGSYEAGTITVTTITESGAPYALANTFFGDSGGVLPVGTGDPVVSDQCFEF